MAESYISELGDSLSHGVANTNGDRVKIIAPKLYNDGNGNHPSIATALSGKVSKAGDTMTGQLVNTMTGEAIKVSHGTGNKDAFVSAERTDQSVKVSFGVGAGGVNHGLYSNKNSNWIVKADTSGNVTVNNGKAGTSIYLGNTNVGATNKPMYLASGKISEGSLYAGGTAVTLNGTSKGASTASFYAPTAVGTSGQVLTSSGSGAPAWTNQSSLGVGAADHLNAYGYTLLWESGAYVASKPYALLAEKTVSTAGNWGFGNLFKIECGNNYAIFKVTMVGSSSAVSTSPSPTIHIIESYGISVSNYSKLIVARYTFTANGTCNVKIYTDWSLTAAPWMRVTLRQLDNQSGDQSAYNNWDKWTFYKQTGNSEMLASVSGTEFAIDYASARFGGTATAATKLSTARKTYVTLGTASTSTTRDWSGDTTIPVDGVLAIANGGTGKTSKTAAEYNLLSKATTKLADTINDNYRFTFETTTPSESNGIIAGYREASTVWSWVKGKLTSDTGVNISGNAATSTSAGKLTTARNVDGISFDGSANIHHYGSCTTAAETAAKTVTLDDSMAFTLAKGASVFVKFQYANGVANPTLDVNGTGAKNIYRYGSTAPSTSAASSWQANSVVHLVYDGSAWQMVGWLNDNTNTYQRVYPAVAGTKYYITGVDSVPASGSNSSEYGYDTTSVYMQDGVITATGFVGPLTGNVTGDCSGSSGSCTGNAATATSATNVALAGSVKTTSTTDGDTIQFQAGSGTAGTVTIVNAKHAASADSATSASSASKVTNKLTLKIKTGTTEGTDLYTYDGSGAKTLDIKQGSNITLTAAAGSLTIAGTADTKNTAGSTDTSSKIFLIGATSQAANPQTYSQDTTYVDTDATLASTKVRVAEKCTLQFNTTTNALDFVFA